MMDDGNTGRFAVNILSERQQELAVRFSAMPDHLRFEGLPWTEGWGEVPLIDGVIASIACSTHSIVEAGDHFILIGEVHDIRMQTGRALVWCESRYHCLPGPPLPL
jgi:3-hydroxy-9,10-secoandrosta-1,3,5(10)-triene-9,17-dione monooxygenase reductase component